MFINSKCTWFPKPYMYLRNPFDMQVITMSFKPDVTLRL